MTEDPQCRRPLGDADLPVDRGVPDCGTGPLGRIRFVARELAALWRDRRRRAVDPAPPPDTTGEE